VNGDGTIMTIERLRFLSDAIERDAVFPAYGGMQK